MKSNAMYFRSIYGASASIFVRADGTAQLIVYDRRGYMIIDKEYNTERGAKVAMGRAYDDWYEVIK